ncbi:MAG: putative zinc-binding metallopeptidase [Flavobacteriaceae bacterium]
MPASLAYPNCFRQFIFCSLFFFSNCQQDDVYVNLSATLSLEESTVEVVEGQALLLAFKLSEKLSEPLPLRMEFRTSLTDKYINTSDYASELEISVDNGQTWTSQPLSQAVIPPLSDRFLIRLSTIDDQLLEFTEEFSWVVVPEEGQLLDIHGYIYPLDVSVQDNEQNAFPVLETPLALAWYTLSDSYDFRLVGLNRDTPFIERRMKQMLDEGLTQAFREDLTTLLQVTNTQLERLDVLYDNSGIGGYVGQLFEDENKWVLGLNLYLAYHEIDHQFREQSYNADGVFGYVMTHEFGHLITLADPGQVNPDILPENCTELFLGEGCFTENSILNQFQEEFYTDALSPTYEPTFVTDYAATHIAEDIAETFAYYIHQGQLPVLQEKSSTALHKLHFTDRQVEIKRLKPLFRESLDINILPTYFPGIRAINGFKDKKQVSCLDVLPLEQRKTTGQ